ncbi:Uncharacterised protein [uncultured archaeon]|nr:Uncharacterised protein [uncultured archaeon]
MRVFIFDTFANCEYKREGFKLNWIERIFGKKEQASPEIGFDELTGWVESRSGKISEEVSRHAVSLYPDIENALGKIKKSTASLEKSTPEGRFHLKLVKIAASNRDNMVKQIRMLIENITIPDDSDIKTVVGFHENSMQTLTVCLENIMKSYQYTKMVFFEESRDVIGDVNALGRLLNQLMDPINENKETIDAFEHVSDATKAIKNMHSDIEKEKKTIKDSDETVVRLKKEIEDTRNDLSRLKESNEWKQYLSYRNELADLEKKAEETESEINALVLPLNKALGRLRQLSESGRYTMAPDVKKGLHLCLTDPKCINPGFLFEFKKIIESDVMDIASDKKNKMLEQIGLVEASFGSYKDRYQTLIQGIEAKKNDISRLNLAAKENNLDKRSTELHNKLALVEKELEISKKNFDSLKLSIESKKQELQDIVSTVDSKVKIRF